MSRTAAFFLCLWAICIIVWFAFNLLRMWP